MSRTSESEGVAFSRSTGLPARFGKRSSSVKSKVPDELKFDAERRAHELGISVSDLVMFLLMKDCWGEEETLRLKMAQARMVLSSGPTSDHEETT